MLQQGLTSDAGLAKCPVTDLQETSPVLSEGGSRPPLNLTATCQSSAAPDPPLSERRSCSSSTDNFGEAVKGLRAFSVGADSPPRLSDLLRCLVALLKPSARSCTMSRTILSSTISDNTDRDVVFLTKPM